MSAWRFLLVLVTLALWFTAGCSSRKIASGDTCTLNSDCKQPLVCTWGTCHDACHTSADCLSGQRCVKVDASTSVCQTADESDCSKTSTCSGGLVCASDQHCRSACVSRSECTSEQMCVSGICAAPTELDSNGQLPRTSTGPLVDGGTSACQAGPGGYCWSLYSDPGATARWVAPPTATSVSLSAQAATDGGAGMIATLSNGAALDLSQYDQLWFDANVPVGTVFDVIISKEDDFNSSSCTWWVTGAGQTRYTVDLQAAKYCVPTACGFDRSQARKIVWATAGWGTDFHLDISLTGFGFAKKATAPQPLTISGDASRGPNGWCWSLIGWSAATGMGSTSSWATPPSTNQVQVKIADTSITSQSGVAVELPANLQDLTSATNIDIDATVLVEGATYFSVSLVDINGAYSSQRVKALAGPQTYSIAIGTPSEVGTSQGRPFNRQAVRYVKVESRWELQETLDITITRIAIRSTGKADAGARDTAVDIPVAPADAGKKDLAADLAVGQPDSRTATVVDGGATGGPVCSDQKTYTDAGSVACSSSDPPTCYETCGPKSLGRRSQTCACGAYVPSDCTFPPGDYSCFKIPNVTPQECPTVAPQEGQPCAIADCIVCGADTGVRDLRGTTGNGYCVCDAATRTWTCGGLTWGNWPCPEGSGCDADSLVPSGCLALNNGNLYSQGAFSGLLWTAAGGTSTISPPCGTSDSCFTNTLAVSGVVAPVPFSGCGYDWGTVWGADLGWSLNQKRGSEALPADLSAVQSLTIGISGARGLALRVYVQMPSGDGGVETGYCAPLNLNNDVATIPLRSLTTECWNFGGARFDPVTMKPKGVYIQVPSTTRQAVPYNFCVTQLKFE